MLSSPSPSCCMASSVVAPISPCGHVEACSNGGEFVGYWADLPPPRSFPSNFNEQFWADLPPPGSIPSKFKFEEQDWADLPPPGSIPSKFKFEEQDWADLAPAREQIVKIALDQWL